MNYTPRHAEERCHKALHDGKVLVLIGPRQTGKSTLARHLLDGLPESSRLSLNLDDPFLRDRLLVQGGLVREIEERLARPWSAVQGLHLLVDEIQKAPGLFEIVKDLYDREPGKIQWILTGSSALQIHDPIAETLSGRVRIVHLPPFTLSEAWAHAHHTDPTGDQLPGLVSRLVSGRFAKPDFDGLVERCRWDARDRRQFATTHLQYPLFPEPSADPQPEEWIRNYLATYVEKDVRSLAAVGNLEMFRACVRQLAARAGSPLKWETAAQEIGTTSITLRRYVGLMEETQILLRLPPFGLNPGRRVVKAPKVWFADPGLLWGLRGFEDTRILVASGMLGTFMEQLAIVEVSKWCALEPTAPQLRFWSKTAVSEVDLVVSNRGFHLPIEIKLGAAFDRRWLRGLDAFEGDMRPLKIEVPYRVVLHLGEPDMPDDRTFVLPLWAFT